MKKLFTIPVIILSHLICFAQGVAINETLNPATSSAILDISSTTKGMLVPRMSGVQRTMIVAPAQGLLVYDTDSRSFWFYDSSWNEISGGGGSFTLPYIGTGSDPDKLFSITNNSPSPGSTTIYGKRLGGSGLVINNSAIWGDNTNGNGVTGTSYSGSGLAGFGDLGIGVSATSISGTAMYAFSTTGFGVSSTSQTNFGLASLSNAIDKAGVLGVNTNNTGVGYGVIGSIENPTSGAAIYGKNNAVGGHAGLFTITNNTNTDHALKVSTTSNGAAGYFTTSGNGKSIYSSTEMGLAGVFEITNATNNNTSLKASTIGTGMAGLFQITNLVNDNTSLKATTNGTGLAGMFTKNNTTGLPGDAHDPAVLIDNISLGNALKINSPHGATSKSALEISYGGSSAGASIISSSDGLRSTSLSANSRAMYASNFQGGIALEAISTSLTADKPTINVNNTAGGTGISCTVYGGEGGTAIRGHVNGSEGIAVWAEVSGDGTGVYAASVSGDALKAQTSGQGRAAQFRAYDTENPNEAVSVEQSGLGVALLVSSFSAVSGQPAMKVKSNNNAPFATFTTLGGSEKIILEKSGNIITDGTITVKENKGIVRNTYSGQLRVETVEAFYDAPGQSINFAPMGSAWINVPFNTAFAAPPVVYLGNYIGDSSTNGDELNPVVIDVTSTGFTLKIQNLTANNITVADHSWKLTAMGVE